MPRNHWLQPLPHEQFVPPTRMLPDQVPPKLALSQVLPATSHSQSTPKSSWAKPPPLNTLLVTKSVAHTPEPDGQEVPFPPTLKPQPKLPGRSCVSAP